MLPEIPIKEYRRGGDKFDYPVHEANIAEAVNHNLTTGALTYEQFFRENDLFRDALPHFPAVNIRRIKEVNVHIERGVHDFIAGLLIRLGSKIHGPQA